MRFLILIIIALIALALINRALGNARRALQEKREDERMQHTKSIPMAQCAYCGVHVPENEAVHYKNKTWCCLEHARTADSM
ncbi:hypothetical protein AAEX37_00504 [Oligella sp. MSHR50489EDL]|uniref:PP0621 family protein n=1 Tax=Oligella sp. MSHR50489EDL TaxID=3139409 RepID=UPI003D819F62